MHAEFDLKSKLNLSIFSENFKYGTDVYFFEIFSNNNEIGFAAYDGDREYDEDLKTMNLEDRICQRALFTGRADRLEQMLEPSYINKIAKNVFAFSY